MLINDLGFENQENNVGDLITCKKKLKEFNTIHLKYVDDFTVAETINMKEQLTSVPLELRAQPDYYHDRTGHILRPENSKVSTN